MKISEKFPDFKMLDKDGEAYTLKSFEDDYLVFFFYPKDSTPGCTIESKGFSKLQAKFSKLGARLIGVSGGDSKSKAKFCLNNSLETLMLSDSDFSLSSKLGIYGEKSFMGRKYMGINRVTYVLDAKKRVIHLFDQVKPISHPEEVLKFLQNYQKKL